MVSDDSITLIHGDCLEEMKKILDKSVDLVVADPPYNMAYSGRSKYKDFRVFTNDDMDEIAHSRWILGVLRQLYRIVKDDSAIYLFIDFRNYARIYNLFDDLWKIKNCIVWNKKSIGMGQRFRFQHEFIIYGEKGQPQLNFDGKGISDIWDFSRDSSDSYRHPTQKPISVMFKPVEYSSNKENLILDPFMGAGTAGVVAKSLGRQYLGIELSSDYIKIAEKRIINTMGRLF